MAHHEVVVGNVGTVYCDTNVRQAQAYYETYCEASTQDIGRAAGESVIWLVDGEIYYEHQGTRDDTFDDND